MPSRFVHGIRAENWVACWNMHLEGAMSGIDFMNEVVFGRPGAREVSIDDLRAGLFDGALSPRMMLLREAAVVRKGDVIGWGAPPYPFVEVSAREQERVVRQADLELRFEEARRELSPGAPSRVGCLFLAEATSTGRTMVSRILRHEAFLMEVKIVACLRLSRVDSRWLEGQPGEKEIAGYWSGQPRDETPIWEFLLDGAIKCTNEDEFARLSDWGREAGVRASGTQGPIGTPGTPGPLRPQAPPSR